MKNLLVSLIAACVSTSALAESYLCISEAAGGVYWENGKWSNAKFTTGQKYLFQDNRWFEWGKKFALADCKKHPYMDDSVTCESFPYHIAFNKEKLRFSAYYLYGFVDGRDSNADTPAVEIGTCSKLN
uniref:hypothetical protein n=1 Tax=Rheinheimera sp. TaxID=1869214 RepID=UPI0040483776